MTSEDTPSTPNATKTRKTRKTSAANRRRKIKQAVGPFIGPVGYLLVLVLMVGGYLAYHAKPSPSPAPAPDDGAEVQVDDAQLLKDIAKAFPADKNELAVDYAAFYDACRAKVEADGISIPEAVAIAVQDTRGLYSDDVPKLDAIVEKYVKENAGDVPSAGKLTDEQKLKLSTTFKNLSGACLAASRD